MSDDKTFVPAVLDREISSAGDDAFGHRHFATLLQGLVEAATNEPPYSIGLLGRWGCGKSSIKSLYLSHLQDDAPGGRAARSKRIQPIIFNAWRFGGEDIKRALLRQVYLELGGDREKLEEALFKQVQKSQPVPKGWWQRLCDTFTESGFSLFVVLLTLVVTTGSAVLIGRMFNLSGPVMALLGGIALPCGTAIIKFLLDSMQVNRTATITKVEAPRSSVEQYEDLLIGQFRSFKSSRPLCERLVIFVDDLDRLSPEEMIGGLDAVRTFMEIPKASLPAGLGIVFVISCDEDRIADALADKRRRTVSSDLPGAVFTQADAHRFLDRIFQFRLEIPPFPKRDMRNYAEAALAKSFPALPKELEKAGIAIHTLIDYMIHVGVETPRNALQIINAFVQSWWIAKQRERDGAGTNAPGGLQEGAVSQHPLALAAVCALRVDFPDFFRDLQQEPELIGKFMDVFLRGAPLSEQSESMQIVLHRYAVPGGDDKTPAAIRQEYRSLRQYIASLQGLRWPKAMRPLIFLSQDPVSRKYGDKALALYDAFVSGDTTGVLAQLGRSYDTTPLSEDDMRFLHEMVEDLVRETPVRQNNAASVLAALADRYPTGTASLLLTPLVRRISESPDLRWRLGVKKIGQVLGSVAPNDRQEAAGCLIRDFLTKDAGITFRLESGESPSLDEAIDMVKQACEIVLRVRTDDGLPAKLDHTLLDWIESRRVLVESRDHTIPMTDLERWVKQYEAWLLPALGARYTNLVLETVEGGEASSLVESDVIRRCHSVFDSLHEAGEESRSEVWKQLRRFLALNEIGYVQFAARFFREHLTSPQIPHISALVAAMANRVLQSANQRTSLEQFEEECAALVEVTDKRIVDLDESSIKTLNELVLRWSQENTTAEISTDLLSPVYQQFADKCQNVVTDWGNRLIPSLPKPCVIWIGKHFAALPDNQRRNCINRLAVFFQTDNFAPDQSQQYEVVMDNMPEDALRTQEFREHLNGMIFMIRQRHNNANNYLRKIFQVIPRVLPYAPPEQVGPMLSELFVHTKNDLALFGWLHEQMADYWPAPAPPLNPYNPERVFSDAMEVLNRRQAPDAMRGPLRTATVLLGRGLAPNERSSDVVDVACRLWRNQQAQATETLTEINAAPSPQAVAMMIDGLDPSDTDSVARLSAAWKAIAERMSSDTRLATGVELMAKSACGPADEPDRCLRIWLTSVSQESLQLMEALFKSDSLNDGQRQRVWLQIERHDDNNPAVFGDLLSTAAARNDSPQTLGKMLDGQDRYVSSDVSQDDRYGLGQHVVKAFRASSSQEAKNRLASFLKRLEVEGVLKELTKTGDLSPDDVAILDSQFGKSRQWRRIRPDSPSK